MKTKAFQTKRKPKKGFRTLYAKTRKRKQRVSAAAAGGDFAGEEPNLGVARALVVILILHVAAIIAIVVHSSRNDEGQLAVKDSPVTRPAQTASVVASSSQAAQPKIGPRDRFEYVEQGDTYERFARRHNVDVQQLRRVNNNTPLKYGLALIVPEPVPAMRPQAPAALAQRNPDPLIQETLPPIVEVPARNEPPGLPSEYEIVEAAQPIAPVAQQSSPIVDSFPQVGSLDLPQSVPAIQVSTPIVEQTPPPAPAPEPVIVQEVTPKPAPAPKPAMKSYTIRKGDTLWAIANRNGISVDKLMSANRSVDPKKMRPGIKVNIPAR